MTAEPSRLRRILSRLAEIKPGEERITFYLFSYFFLITAAYSIIKSLRVASYLESLGADKLPLAYLLTAMVAGLVVAVHSKLQVRLSRLSLIIMSLSFFILTALLFWFLFSLQWAWLSLAYYVWANIFLAVVITQFWIVVNDTFNPRETRRLVGLFGSGGILGGIIGGEATGLMARSSVDTRLLLLACGFLLTAVAVVCLIAGWQKKTGQSPPQTPTEPSPPGETPGRVGFRDCLLTVAGHRYFRLLAAGISLSLVVSTFVDWQFSKVVEGTTSLENRLTSFFGHFNAGLLVTAFFIQIFLTSRFVQKFGLKFSFLIYPSVLIGALTGLAALPASLAMALTLKASDKSLSYTLNQSVRELLYIPVAPEIKYKAKVFIDMFLNRFSRGLGGLLLMGLLSFNQGLRFISLITILLILGWIVLNLRVTNEYAAIVRKKLKKKWDRADRAVAEQLDLDYLKLVFDAVDSRRRSGELMAMDLFDLLRRQKLKPELKELIASGLPQSGVSSLGTLFEEELPSLSDWPAGEREDLFKQEIDEIFSLETYQELIKDYIKKVLALKKPEAEIARMEAAKLIGLMKPNRVPAEELADLLEDESPEVSRLAMDSAARCGQREHLEAIIRKLANPVTREDAVASLLTFGSKITGTLSDYIEDRDSDPEIKKSIINVLSRIANQEAADLLALELLKNQPDLDSELIEALDRIRHLKPEISLPAETIRKKLKEVIVNQGQLLLASLEARGKAGPPDRSLEQELTRSLIDMFKLLGFIYPPEDISRAWQNFRAGSGESKAYALELLDSILIKADREWLLPLLEDLPPADRKKRIRTLLEKLGQP
ncbi:MAG: Npt1/Npt2 family nucleotide transporter [Candidatus Saccharicenans sp.]|nr:Npt1/Npt2 family nucleotide transporter [Candidatus Saccharicenans sp.]